MRTTWRRIWKMRQNEVNHFFICFFHLCKRIGIVDIRLVVLANIVLLRRRRQIGLQQRVIFPTPLPKILKIRQASKQQLSRRVFVCHQVVSNAVYWRKKRILFLQNMAIVELLHLRIKNSRLEPKTSVFSSTTIKSSNCVVERRQHKERTKHKVLFFFNHITFPSYQTSGLWGPCSILGLEVQEQERRDDFLFLSFIFSTSGRRWYKSLRAMCYTSAVRRQWYTPNLRHCLRLSRDSYCFV